MAIEQNPQISEAVSLEERSRIISRIFDGVKQTPEFKKPNWAYSEVGLTVIDWIDRKTNRYFCYRNKGQSERLFFLDTSEWPERRLSLNIERDGNSKIIDGYAHQEHLGDWKEMFDNSRALLEYAPKFIKEILPSFSPVAK